MVQTMTLCFTMAWNSEFKRILNLIISCVESLFTVDYYVNMELTLVG